MKHVLVILEGIGDVPRRELDGRTPLQVARCPVAGRLAVKGRCGRMSAVASSQDQSPAFLLAALCGASLSDAARLHRGAVEAAGLEDGAGDYRWACRGNFVTMDGGSMRESRVQRMSFDETAVLCAALQEGHDPATLCFTPLAPSRAVVRMNPAGDAPLAAANPAWVSDDAESLMPSGRKGQWVREMLAASAGLLARQTLNDVRIDLGENPATHLWLWGGGELYRPHSFFGGAGRKGTVMTQSPMARGMARLMGFGVLPMETPWSSEDPGPAFDEAAFKSALGRSDVVVVYVEAPNEGASYGSVVEKVRMLERIDIKVLGPVVRALEGIEDTRVLLTADMTASADYARVGGKTPLLLWSSGAQTGDGVDHFDEAACEGGTLGTVAPEKVYGLLSGE